MHSDLGGHELGSALSELSLVLHNQTTSSLVTARGDLTNFSLGIEAAATPEELNETRDESESLRGDNLSECSSSTVNRSVSGRNLVRPRPLRKKTVMSQLLGQSRVYK